MADNVAVVIANATSATIATDDVAGIHYQLIKISHGSADAATQTALGSPLPVAAQQQTGVIMVGAVQATPQFALVSASSSTTKTIVTAVTSARIRVLSYVLVVRATTSVTFNSSTTPQTGIMIFNTNSGAAAGYTPLGHFQTAVGQPLTVQTGGGAVGGHLTYVEVSA